MEKASDYYEVLGMNRDVTSTDIKKAYRELAKKYHPDLNKQQGSEEIFKIIQEAYETLIDPDKRKNYDAMNINNDHEFDTNSENSNYSNENSDNSDKSNDDNTNSNSYTSYSETENTYENYNNVDYNYKSVRSGFTFSKLVRGLFAFAFLIAIPFIELVFYSHNLNNILLYYGWLLIAYIFTKWIYSLTVLGLFIWFIVSLFEGKGILLIYIIIIFFVVSLIVWIIRPSLFDN